MALKKKKKKEEKKKRRKEKRRKEKKKKKAKKRASERMALRIFTPSSSSARPKRAQSLFARNPAFHFAHQAAGKTASRRRQRQMTA